MEKSYIVYTSYAPWILFHFWKNTNYIRIIEAFKKQNYGSMKLGIKSPLIRVDNLRFFYLIPLKFT